jgi:hypothetical protein
MTEAAFRLSDQVRGKINEKQALIDQIQQKMRKVVDEFACGEISREQFHRIYEHYQAQIMLAAQWIAETDGALTSSGISAGETIAIRKQFMAKAKAMAVYYHSTGQILETIGDFDVPADTLSPLLNNLHDHVLRRNSTPPLIIPFDNQWLLVVSGKFSTSIMLFSNEPAARQISIISNMHRDFETANETALRSGNAESSNLVFPFMLFVRKSVGMK